MNGCHRLFKYAIAIAALFALLTTTMPPAARAQDPSETQTVEVIGTGRITNENISTARKEAISDALVTAVGMVASELLHTPVIVESFDDVNRLLLTDAGSFVQYKILTEATTGAIYRVMVEATVSVYKIRDLLTQNSIMVQDETPLKVLLLIAEKQLGDLSYQYWWKDPFVSSISEASLAAALEMQGITIVEHGQFLPSDLDAPLAGTENSADTVISDAQAAAFGAWFQADVVIIGTATAQEASNAMENELRSFKGSLSIRAVRTDTGEVLVEATRNYLTTNADDSIGGRKALEAAGTRTGALLAGQLHSAWQQTQEMGPTAMTIVVAGGYQLSHFVSFRRLLSELPGVTALQTRAMTPEETLLALDYDGTPQNLAETLLLESFDSFGIFITEATPESLRLQLRPN